MLYVVEISTPANTTETNKKRTVVQMEQGIVRGFEVYFPPGSAGLLHCHIDDVTHQVWPKTPRTDFAANDVTIRWEDEYSLLYPPYELQIYTWNLDDTYAHNIRVRFWIEQVKVFRLTPEFLEQRGKERG